LQPLATQQVREESLGEIPRILRAGALAPAECIDLRPVGAAKFLQSTGRRRRGRVPGGLHYAPMSSRERPNAKTGIGHGRSYLTPGWGHSLVEQKLNASEI